MVAIRKALVVDDDPDMLRLCKVSLEIFSNWQVEVASSVDLALRVARDRVPDVILLDLMMPDGGGPAVLQRLKCDSATACIPVVVMTAAHNTHRLQAEGTAGIISKPFDPSTLHERIVGLVVAASPPEGSADAGPDTGSLGTSVAGSAAR